MDESAIVDKTAAKMGALCKVNVLNYQHHKGSYCTESERMIFLTLRPFCDGLAGPIGLAYISFGANVHCSNYRNE